MMGGAGNLHSQKLNAYVRQKEAALGATGRIIQAGNRLSQAVQVVVGSGLGSCRDDKEGFT